MKKFVQEAVENWYKNEYGEENNFISYKDNLEKKETIHCHKTDSPFGELYCGSFSPSSKNAKSLTFLRLKDEEVTITKDNIHLYYKFMSGVDKHTNLQVVMDAFDNRTAEIERRLDVRLITPVKEFNHFKGNPIGQTVFGVKDTLKPLDEYITQIKNSHAYQGYKNQDTAQSSIKDIKTDPELETPEGLKQAQDELKQKITEQNQEKVL